MSIEYSEGITVESLDDDATCQGAISRQKRFTGLVRFKPSNSIMPNFFCDFQKRMREFQVRKDDVWICSFPKTGTTWTQEMVWCIMNDLDFEEAEKTPLDTRIPFVELVGIKGNLPETFVPVDTIAMADSLPSPRILKTHLFVDLIPKGILEDSLVKVIYVVRNPRDVCVSLHNHLRIIAGYTGTVEDLANDFLNDMTPLYGPFMDHVLGYWKATKEHGSEKILFLRYEEMKSDLRAVVRKIGDFLGKDRLDESKEQQLLDHLSFERMKGNPAVNKASFVDISSKFFDAAETEEDRCRFMHSGKSGRWREVFKPETVLRFEEWERKGLEGMTDFKFSYD